MEISGSSAIVTGGASGLGAATCTRLASRGVHVVIAAPLSPRVIKEVKRIVSVAHAHRLRVGIFCPDVPFAREMVSLGCDLVTVMNDAGLLRKATAALIEELRQPVRKRTLADV